MIAKRRIMVGLNARTCEHSRRVSGYAIGIWLRCLGNFIWPRASVARAHLNHHTETESADLREACTLLYRRTDIRSATFAAPCVKVDASRQRLDVRRHRSVEAFTLRIAKPVVIAPNATLIGEAETGANSSLQAGGPRRRPRLDDRGRPPPLAGRLASLCVSWRAEFRCPSPTLCLTSAPRSLRGPPSRAKAGDD
jgi:hypothetical protein